MTLLPLFLSLDDEWKATGGSRLMRDFESLLTAWAASHQLALVRCTNLADAANELQQAHAENRRVAAMLLDAMLNKETAKDFKAFGWSKPIKRMDAGLQLASLLTQIAAAEPAARSWLQHCEAARIVVLTTSNDAAGLMPRFGLTGHPRVTHQDKNEVLTSPERIRAMLDSLVAKSR